MILLWLWAVWLLLTIICFICLCVLNNKLLKITNELIEDNIKLNKENLILNIEKAKLTEKATILETWIDIIGKEIDKKLKKSKSTHTTTDYKEQILDLHKQWLSNKEIWEMLWFNTDTVRKAIAKWKAV